MIPRSPGIEILGLAACLLAGCTSTQLPGLDARRWQCSRDDRLVGTWATGIVVSQLGAGSGRITFNCDCSYKESYTGLMAILPIRGSATGWYTASGNALVTETGRMRVESTYRLEGDVLVIRQGTQSVRYSNVKRRSCTRTTVPPQVPAPDQLPQSAGQWDRATAVISTSATLLGALERGTA
jgi:hypothetical protein